MKIRPCGDRRLGEFGENGGWGALDDDVGVAGQFGERHDRGRCVEARHPLACPVQVSR
jgi:hypothetical protein